MPIRSDGTQVDDVTGPDGHRAVPSLDEQRPVEAKVDGRADQRAIRCLDPHLRSHGGRAVPMGGPQSLRPVGGLQILEAGLKPGQHGSQQGAR